jgi:hypothetical protein
MMYYFDRAGAPTERVLRIPTCLNAILSERNWTGELGLWSCAWLDVIVHANPADAALAVDDVWTGDVVTLDLERLRERRLQETLRRYAEIDDHPIGPTAASRRSRRQPDEEQDVG